MALAPSWFHRQSIPQAFCQFHGLFRAGCIPQQSFRAPDMYLGTFSMKSIRQGATYILMQDLICAQLMDVDRARSICVGNSNTGYMHSKQVSITDRN